MFGGYFGQDKAKAEIERLEEKLKREPSIATKKELEEVKKRHKERMDSALRSYMRI